jgi:hypothetical protein
MRGSPHRRAQAGEAEKQKSYEVTCRLPVPVTPALLAGLSATRDLLLQQTTPERVAHRRALLVRAGAPAAPPAAPLSPSSAVVRRVGSRSSCAWLKECAGCCGRRAVRRVKALCRVRPAWLAPGWCADGTPLAAVRRQVRPRMVHEMAATAVEGDPHGIVLRLRTQARRPPSWPAARAVQAVCVACRRQSCWRSLLPTCCKRAQMSVSYACARHAQ